MNEPKHLFLTGFRGTGKSTVGRLLAQRLELPIVDLDDVIEQRAGKSIRAIFEQGGERLFRELESEALAEVVQGPPTVIALGGGAILRDANRELVRERGICFWLDADPETILGRLQQDETTAERRPALTHLPELEEIRQLLAQRRPLYQQAAHHRLESAGRDSEQIAEQILLFWQAATGSGSA